MDLVYRMIIGKVKDLNWITMGRLEQSQRQTKRNMKIQLKMLDAL